MSKRTEKEHPATRLRLLMSERNYSIARLSKSSGIQASVISRILSEQRDFKFSTSIRLAKGLKISLDTLAGRPDFTVEQLEKARALSSKLDDVLWKNKL
jgi:transcriptional regulator with XRE-family HTH domain